MNRYSAFQDSLNTRTQPLQNFLQRDPVNIFLTLAIVMYAGHFVRKLPKQVEDLFAYRAVKIGYLALIGYLMGVNASMAILLALAGYMTLVKFRGENTTEAFQGMRAIRR